MPLYDLMCPDCNYRFEVLMKHDAEVECEECSNPLTCKDQIHHAVMFDLKGPGGWYSEGKSIPGCDAKPKEPTIEYLTGEDKEDD